MCRILILDDEIRDAESLKLVVDGFEENRFIAEIATNPDMAADYARAAIENGQPYTVFIVDQRLGPGMDGIEVLKQLRYISRDSYAVMLTGNADSEIGRRAYEAGAYRYLTKPADEKEMLFVLNSALQERRAEIESRWRKVFSEMMETALQRESFDEVARVVVGHCIRLGFERAHLFWAPKQGRQAHQKIMVGVACEGEQCLPAFHRTKFNLHEKRFLWHSLNSRNMVFFHENETRDGFKAEIESIGCPYPRGGLWLLPLWSGEELAGFLLLDFGKTKKYLTPDHHALLDFLARQVSVVLEHSRLYNEQKRTGDEMELLQRASVEMLRIGNHSKEYFWHTVLTIATANFGLKFNRAWLFLREDNSSAFRGWAAVGTNDSHEAFCDWENASGITLDSFLADVFAKRICLTPLNDLVLSMEIFPEELHAEVWNSLRSGQTVILTEREVVSHLPNSFMKAFSPSEAAVLPVQVGSTLQGCVLVDNKHLSSTGFLTYGRGFVVTPEVARKMIDENPANADVVKPLLSAGDFADRAVQECSQFVINFGNRSETRSAAYDQPYRWLVENAKEERLTASRDDARKNWWLLVGRAERVYELATRLGLKQVLGNLHVAKYHAFALLSAHLAPEKDVNVFALESLSAFAVLQSRVHEAWADRQASSLHTRRRYTTTTCFATFPFPWRPPSSDGPVDMQSIGKTYYDFRAALMVRNNEGLTKTYNRFHDPDESDPDILKLRELHAAMDRAVLDAYGWTDLQPTCEFLLVYEEEDEEEAAPGARRKKKPWRYRGPDDFRDEVLAKLLELNAQRAKAEQDAATAAANPTKKPSPRGKKAAAANPNQESLLDRMKERS